MHYLYNLVRASNPKYQGAITFYKNFPVRILQVTIQQNNLNEEPGTIIDSNNGIMAMTADQQIVSIDIVHVNEGYYTGKTFKKMFSIQYGDKFEKS